MANIEFDSSEVEKNIEEFLAQTQTKTQKALQDVASEILRLSQFEVPHDTGNLQNSGQIDPGNPDDIIVGYNTVYAAYQHEGVRPDGTHEVHNWQSNRKKKYLEDPIKMNLEVFRGYIEGVFES